MNPTRTAFASKQTTTRMRQTADGRSRRSPLTRWWSAAAVVATGTLAPLTAGASTTQGCPSPIMDPISAQYEALGIIEIPGATQLRLTCDDITGDIVDPTSRQYVADCIIEIPGAPGIC